MAARSKRKVFCISIQWVIFIASYLCGCMHTGSPQVSRLKDKLADLPPQWESSVILLENRTELTFEMHNRGNRVKRKDIIWAYVKKRNPNLMEKITLFDVDSYEKPVKIKAKAYYPGGSRWTLADDAIRREKIPFSNLYANEFSIPGYDEGVIIRLETKRDYFHPEFVGTFVLRNEYPALSRRLSLAFPEDCDLTYGLENFEGAEVEESFAIKDGHKIFEVRANKLSDKWPPWKTEFPEQWYAALFVSFPPRGRRSYTWRELGDHYLKLSKGAFESSPEIAAMAQSIKGTSQNELIENAFNAVVGKIRYHADEEERFAFFPRKAATIFSNGYGDCKEISTLLKTLLQGEKIGTYLTLVSTRNKMQPVRKYPSLDNFNHVILAAGTHTGRYRFLDGTQTWAKANNSYYELIGQTAFLLKPGGSQLIQIPADNNYKNIVITRSKIRREIASGRWIIEGNIELMGRPALNFFSRFNWSDTAEKKSLAKIYLQKEFGIYPLEFDFKALDSNEAHFTFKALFQENYISIGKGGFRLGSPRLFGRSVNDSLGQKKGPKVLESFEQQDTWEFGPEFQDSQLYGFHLPFADCSYSAQGNKFIRTYTQKDRLFQENDTQLESWTEKIKSAMNSICWR